MLYAADSSQSFLPTLHVVLTVLNIRASFYSVHADFEIKSLQESINTTSYRMINTWDALRN